MIRAFVRRLVTAPLVAFSIADDGAATVLRLVATDSSSWVGLYRIIEAVEAEMGGRNPLVKAGWVSRDELRSFKHTANSPIASGALSRHGREFTAPPKLPMLLADAEPLVAGIVMSWLEARCGNAI